MKNLLCTSLWLLCLAPSLLYAQPEDLTQVWPAQWVAAAEGDWRSYGVQRFRHRFSLDSLPAQLVVHTSGDNRYQLYVNGTRVTWGPLRGDLDHWYYESTDIAPYLRVGPNVLAAEVLNYGAHPPDAQMSVQTAFLLAADDQRFRHLNTPSGWKATTDPAYRPNRVDDTQVRGYYGGGSREIVDGRAYLWDWAAPGYEDAAWAEAAVVERAFARTCIWASRWKLTPRDLPLERVTPQPFAAVRLAEGVAVSPDFVGGNAPVQVPAGQTARLILDQGVETTAFPRLRVSGGQGTVITLRYVEAPVIGEGRSRRKGNRNEIAGKTFFGYFDRFIAGGGPDRLYRPFHWRAFRYVEVVIETADEPLTLLSLDSEAATFPFDTRAHFRPLTADSALVDTLRQILTVGERTLRCCAHETFMDCPYYEESQFPGDTRVQALISYVLFGDTRLGQQAIRQFAWSVTSEGFISARYPTNSRYYIPNYSLYWVGMLHDYMRYAGDPALVAEHLPVMHHVLGYFLRLARPDGSLRRPAYHNFVDWSFPRGEAPVDAAGYSALVDLHGLLALQWAAELEAYAGDPLRAAQYQQAAAQMIPTLHARYWRAEAGLFSDTAEGAGYSTHTQHLAILTGLVQGAAAAELMRQALAAPDLVQPTIYWRFYEMEALAQAGLGDRYLDQLGIWKEMLRAGVTTWPETGLESRSECHGWGASPNYHLYTVVAGVQPAAPGFAQVRIAPQLGPLTGIAATVPHPAGQVQLDLRREGAGLRGQVVLPPGIHGSLEWGGRQLPLRPGPQPVALP